MKHLINGTTRCLMSRVWVATNAMSMDRNYDAGQIDRQQHYRESDPSNGQL